jgi:hypothetical protein
VNILLSTFQLDWGAKSFKKKENEPSLFFKHISQLTFIFALKD